MDYLNPITTALTNGAMSQQWPSQLANYEQQRLAGQGSWNPMQTTQQSNSGMDTSALASIIGSLASSGSTSTAPSNTFNVSYGSGSSGGSSSLPAMTTNYNIGNTDTGQTQQTQQQQNNLSFSGWGDSYLTSGQLHNNSNPFMNNSLNNSNYSYYSGLH